ncbi:hypothetical protein [Dyella flagellata]|uniref:hypothetical protein n=1 Tax=Dyella flagellata TaxID=1867833 RepID=UPI0024E0AB2F|nr:hypothetical protein [Dyella flagellata]
MLSRLLCTGIAALLLAAVANVSASSSRSTPMQVSLVIEELCQITGLGVNQSPVVQCRHETPYRVIRRMSGKLAADPRSTDATYQAKSAGGFWVVQF